MKTLKYINIMKTFRLILNFTLAFVFAGYSCSSSKNAQRSKDKDFVDAKYECSWRVKFINDTISMIQGPEDRFILLIGDDYAYEYSQTCFLRDSMFDNYSAAHTPLELKNRNLLWGNDLFRARLYKDYKSKKITVVDMISHHRFIYEEELISQNWLLKEDTIIIAGYMCQRAECRWRGRDWTAWFTPEIPISEGPWKFMGLPGLIVKLHDTKRHYEFELAKFRETDAKIDIQPVLRGTTTYFLNQPVNTVILKPRKIERKEFLRLMYGNQIYDMSAAQAATVGIQLAPRDIKFDHLERDYK